MVELPDTRGLICGFQLREDGIPEPLNWDIASDPNRKFDRPAGSISIWPMFA